MTQIEKKKILSKHLNKKKGYSMIMMRDRSIDRHIQITTVEDGHDRN